MSRTSKKYFPKEFKNMLWDSFLAEIKKSKTGQDLDMILGKYLTESEKIMLEKRLGISHLLKSGQSYTKISEEIDVTRKTISFIKRGFKKPVTKKRENSPTHKSAETNFAHKKNSIMPTYTGKGRWKI